VARLLNHWHDAGFVNLLLVPSEGLVIFFMLVRRRTEKVSHRLWDWALGFGAFCCPLLVWPAADNALVAPIVAAPILLMGMLVQVHAKLVLGRSFGVVAAHRGLKLAGPYRFVRHPMYAGYFVEPPGISHDELHVVERRGLCGPLRAAGSPPAGRGTAARY
jgi:hypothetical protein